MLGGDICEHADMLLPVEKHGEAGGPGQPGIITGFSLN